MEGIKGQKHWTDGERRNFFDIWRVGRQGNFTRGVSGGQFGKKKLEYKQWRKQTNKPLASRELALRLEPSVNLLINNDRMKLYKLPV